MRRVTTYIIKVWLALLASASFVGCADVFVPSETLAHNEGEHTIVMYLLADNNLSSSIYQNALDAEMGMVGASPAVRLVIYLDRADKTELYEVRYLPYGAGGEHIRSCKTLKTYPKQTSTKPEVMRQVLEDVKRLAPSKSYGLVVTGHGSGWFPTPSSGTSYDNQKAYPVDGGAEYLFPHSTLEEPRTRFMGYDQDESDGGAPVRSYISTEDMVKGLQPIHFDYIIFDACFMSSVEFLYAMRHSADYLVASPVEVMACGLPYCEIVGNLASTEHNISSICDVAMEVYMRDNNFSYEKSLALAVVDCSKLDALADAVGAVYRAVGGIDPLQTIGQRVDRSQVQHLDRMYKPAFYDLRDFVCQLAGQEHKTLYEQFLEALDEAIVHSLHTEQIFSLGQSDMLGYNYDYLDPIRESGLSLCGLNTYIPFAEAPLTSSLYMQTLWAQKIYSAE